MIIQYAKSVLKTLPDGHLFMCFTIQTLIMHSGHLINRGMKTLSQKGRERERWTDMRENERKRAGHIISFFFSLLLLACNIIECKKKKKGKNRDQLSSDFSPSPVTRLSEPQLTRNDLPLSVKHVMESFN